MVYTNRLFEKVCLSDWTSFKIFCLFLKKSGNFFQTDMIVKNSQTFFFFLKCFDKFAHITFATWQVCLYYLYNKTIFLGYMTTLCIQLLLYDNLFIFIIESDISNNLFVKKGFFWGAGSTRWRVFKRIYAASRFW